jgi:hypothetical protein
LSDRVVPLDGLDASDELPLGALHARLLLEGPGSSATVIADGEERIISYEEARNAAGPIRSHVRRLGPVSIAGPEPCRFAEPA